MILIIHINLLNVQIQAVKININKKINKYKMNKNNKQVIKMNKKINMFNKYNKMNLKDKYSQILKKRIN
jgi:hypothetical protein